MLTDMTSVIMMMMIIIIITIITMDCISIALF